MAKNYNRLWIAYSIVKNDYQKCAFCQHFNMGDPDRCKVSRQQTGLLDQCNSFSLSEDILCPDCQKKINPTMKTCPACNYKLVRGIFSPRLAEFIIVVGALLSIAIGSNLSEDFELLPKFLGAILILIGSILGFGVLAQHLFGWDIVYRYFTRRFAFYRIP